jgi:hypothetical protein
VQSASSCHVTPRHDAEKPDARVKNLPDIVYLCVRRWEPWWSNKDLIMAGENSKMRSKMESRSRGIYSPQLYTESFAERLVLFEILTVWEVTYVLYSTQMCVLSRTIDLSGFQAPARLLVPADTVDIQRVKEKKLFWRTYFRLSTYQWFLHTLHPYCYLISGALIAISVCIYHPVIMIYET